MSTFAPPLRGPSRLGRRISQPRRVVLEEDASHKLAAGAHVRLFEDPFQVILNGPRREEQALGDCARVETLRDQLGHQSLALGQPIRRRNKRSQLGRARRLEYYDSAALWPIADRGSVHKEPAPCARA